MSKTHYFTPVDTWESDRPLASQKEKKITDGPQVSHPSVLVPDIRLAQQNNSYADIKRMTETRRKWVSKNLLKNQSKKPCLYRAFVLLFGSVQKLYFLDTQNLVV